MLYKPSRYNLMNESFEGDLLIANLLNTTFIKIGVNYALEIKKLLECGGIGEETASAYPQLVEKKMLVPMSVNEYELANLRYFQIAFSNDVLDITIIPTDACNFKCSYCYQENRHNQFLDEKNVAKILRFLERNVRYFKKVQIGWFGGEPLLMKDTIISFLKEAKKICNKYRVPMLGKMTSNGYLLDLETFQVLLKYNVVHYQITIDGNRETHNKQRPHKTESDSFDRIMKNLLCIAENEKRYFRIALRVNITKDVLENMNEYFDTLAPFANNDRFQIHWQYVKDYGGEQVHLLDDRRINESRDFTDFIELATKRNLGSLSYMFFGVGNGLCEAPRKNSYFIDHEAKLHKCTVALYDEETKDINNIGYIDERGIAVIEPEKEAIWLVRNEVPDECRECICFPLCMAQTCPQVRKLKNRRACINEKDELIFYLNYLAKTGVFDEYIELKGN
ncbi:MAG: radical SAM protein [Lachnospiraceae bacterium]|nr:radical SAM protein [Lachnospiraceae bacterium]